MNLRTAFKGASGSSGAPSLRRIAASHAIALLAGFPLALLVILPFGAAFEALGRAGLHPQVVRFLSLFLSYFVQSAALALVLSLPMRASIRHLGEFITGSGLAGVALFPALYPASQYLANGLHLPGIAAGALVGLGFGLLLGMVQCAWLLAGRKRWLAVSALAWATAWGALFPIIYTVLYSH